MVGNVKQTVMMAPNGEAGRCERSGLIASARNPKESPSEPTLIVQPLYESVEWARVLTRSDDLSVKSVECIDR
jgi:hypothetical protein